MRRPIKRIESHRHHCLPRWLKRTLPPRLPLLRLLLIMEPAQAGRQRWRNHHHRCWQPHRCQWHDFKPRALRYHQSTVVPRCWVKAWLRHLELDLVECHKHHKLQRRCYGSCWDWLQLRWHVQKHHHLYFLQRHLGTPNPCWNFRQLLIHSLELGYQHRQEHSGCLLDLLQYYLHCCHLLDFPLVQGSQQVGVSTSRKVSFCWQDMSFI
jgi:hypothetical protein